MDDTVVFVCSWRTNPEHSSPTAEILIQALATLHVTFKVGVERGTELRMSNEYIHTCKLMHAGGVLGRRAASLLPKRELMILKV